MERDDVGPLFGNLFKTLASALKTGERLNVRQSQSDFADLSPTEMLLSNAVSNSAPIRAQIENAPARSPLGAGPHRTASSYRPRYCPPAAEAHDMGFTRPPLVSATS